MKDFPRIKRMSAVMTSHAGAGEQESQKDQSPEKGRAPASPPTSSERGEDPRYSPVPVSIGACGLIRAMPEKY